MNRLTKLVVLSLIVWSLQARLALAQPADLMQRVAELSAQAKWPEVVALLEQAVEGDGRSNPVAWYQLARAYEQVERWSDVVDAGNASLDAGHPQPAVVHLAMARAFVSQDRSKSALSQLEKLAAQGSSRGLKQAVEGAPAFEALRGDPRFAAVVHRLTPCSDEPFRQFDFWLGDFRVENPRNVVGENEITLRLGGCMLLESWQGSGGMHGMSLNFYDPADQTWNQVFVDNNGAPSEWPPLKGKLEKDGSMVLWSPEGPSRSRWTWKQVEGGKVRQKAEQTSDGGKTWQVTWDSYYVPRSHASPASGG